ncbi:MAG: M20 family metallopeptidase [Bacillota bacterium]
MDFFKEALNVQSQMVTDRRWLHQNAEIGMQLPKTTEYVKKRLVEMGYEPTDVCESGVSATVGKGGGKVILLRADMDALPVLEESGESFSATNGNMHACGHDMHTAILLGVAKMLKEWENEIEGVVKLMFQPAEEVFLGAKAMIKGGVLENPKVDAALALHVGGMLKNGEITLHPGVAMSSCNGFKIKITGKGAHGAMPETGIDPINVGVHIVQSLQVIPSRETSLAAGALVTIGAFNAGAAPNVIPNTAELLGTMRTFNEPIREETLERVKTIAHDTAKMFRAESEFEVLSDVPCMINDEGLAATIKQYILDMPGLPDEILEGEPLSGSEDFACVGKHVPAVMFWLGASADEQEKIFPPHHPKALYNESCMPIGAASLAGSAIRWLRENK